jgi:hypothetical protein
MIGLFGYLSYCFGAWQACWSLAFISLFMVETAACVAAITHSVEWRGD